MQSPDALAWGFGIGGAFFQFLSQLFKNTAHKTEVRRYCQPQRLCFETRYRMCTTCQNLVRQYALLTLGKQSHHYALPWRGTGHQHKI